MTSEQQLLNASLLLLNAIAEKNIAEPYRCAKQFLQENEQAIHRYVGTLPPITQQDHSNLSLPGMDELPGQQSILEFSS